MIKTEIRKEINRWILRHSYIIMRLLNKAVGYMYSHNNNYYNIYKFDWHHLNVLSDGISGVNSFGCIV